MERQLGDSFGSSSFVRLIPKKPRTMFRIKYARNTMIKPTIAATIVFLAPSTALLSPPDNIHLIPPQIKKARAITTAITNRTVTTVLIIPPKLSMLKAQRPAKSPFGQASTEVWAKAKDGARK